MKQLQALMAKMARRDGEYIRRVSHVEAIPGGVRVHCELIGFRNMGDNSRPIIVSDEPLAQQTIFTNVPNQPAEVALPAQDQPQHSLTLEIQALTPRCARIRLGEQLAQPHASAMLLPDVQEDWEQLPLPALHENAGETLVVAGA